MLLHVASPVEETVTSVVGTLAVVHAPHVAAIGVSVIGVALQWPVAVNCTGVPFALAIAGLTLSDCSSRGPLLPPQPLAINAAAASNESTLSGNLLIRRPLLTRKFRPD